MDGQPIRLLLVEDDEDDFVLTRDLLSEIKGTLFHIDWVRDYHTALLRLTNSGYDVYLVDYRLGSRTGLELLREAVRRGCQAPIIVLTGQGERDLDYQAMKAGAADFLTKGRIDSPMLERSIRYALQRCRDREALRQARDELKMRVQQRTAALERMNKKLQTEIIERKRAHRKLHRQREWLRVTLASIGDAVIVTNAESRVIFLNPVAQALTGWEQADAAGQFLPAVFDIVNEQTRQPDEDPVARVIRHGAIVGLSEHTILRSRDGTERSIEDSAAPIRDEQRDIVGVVLIFRDVTERRKADRSLREADRRKDEFLAMLAHELRNPLSPIRNGLHILRMPDLSRADGERVQVMMEQQVRNLTRLVDDLLDVSRITRGMIQLRKETVDLNAIINNAAGVIQPLIKLQRHDLVVSLPEEPLFLKADPTRLEQVFTNLLSNAAKYTEPGGRIELTVDPPSTTDDSPSRQVEISIQDTGMGISEELLPRIFDMFTQADRTLDRTQGGLGVGLTLVRRLVELHGGSVEAHSEGQGQGSEFVVRLPALSPREPEPVEPRDEPASTSGAARRVLVVEDERSVAEMLVMLLKLWGHTVRAAYDGPAALMTASTFHPEIVLCDIGLPGMDGYEVARQLRQLDGQANPVLIAITGYGQEEDRRRSARAGFDQHLTKPVDPLALEKMLISLGPAPNSATVL
jgi:two-component system CheB/CheR fusion protein